MTTLKKQKTYYVLENEPGPADPQGQWSCRRQYKVQLQTKTEKQKQILEKDAIL